MIKDFLISFKDNFKEKTRNPFLGTYLIVWLIRNWELVYTLFNFDNDKKLSDKIDFIKSYYVNHDFIINILTNIYWAFGVLILTYVLLNLSRFIVNFSEKRLTPWVYKITDSKSIVLKSSYDSLRLVRDDLQIRLDQERESKSRLETRIKTLEAEIIEITKNKNIYNENKSQDSSKDNTPEVSSILFKKLIDKGLLNDFIATSVKINQQEPIRNDYAPKDYFLELGLITFMSVHFANEKIYKLTPDGESVLKLHRLK